MNSTCRCAKLNFDWRLKKSKSNTGTLVTVKYSRAILSYSTVMFFTILDFLLKVACRFGGKDRAASVSQVSDQELVGVQKVAPRKCSITSENAVSSTLSCPDLNSTWTNQLLGQEDLFCLRWQFWHSTKADWVVSIFLEHLQHAR